jgi:transposase
MARLSGRVWPGTTIYNRFNRWSQQGVWEDVFYALTGSTGLIGGVTACISRHVVRQVAQKGAWRGLSADRAAHVPPRFMR